MNNPASWTHNPIIKIILAFALLSIAAILYSVASNTQASLSGHHHSHSEQPDDASVVIMENDDILATEELELLHDPVLNELYGKHYEKTGRIERSARFTSSLKSTGEDTYRFSIQFLPSRTDYTVSLDITDINSGQFSLEVE